MHMHRYRDGVSDAERVVVADKLAQLFDEVADRKLPNPVAKVFGHVADLNAMLGLSRFGLGVALDEIGYLSGGSHPHMGVVSRTLRLVGERMHEEYLKATEAADYRRMQDGSHVLLHLANVALPREPMGGVKPVDSEPLKLAFEKLAEDADFEHVIKLSGVVLRTLQWRQWNHELARRIPERQLASRSYEIESAAEIYEPVWKNASRAITRLALDRMAMGGTGS